MALKDSIQLLKKLPFDTDFQEELDEIAFLRLSYEANGSDYTKGSSPDGKIITKFPCEEFKDYEVRCNNTPTRSYVSSIINKYNASVFRNEPKRPTDNEIYSDLYTNADGYGMTLNQLMRDTLETAQIDGCSYLLADSTATDTEILTIAQKQSAGIRPYIRLIKKDSVINYEEIEETLISAIVLLDDAEGNTFARYMDNEIFIDIKFNKEYIVTDISTEYTHGYSAIPLVEVEPFEHPQSKPVAYSQKVIVNILSLLYQEQTDQVFTKYIVSGIRIPSGDDSNKQKLTWGTSRMTLVEDQVKLDRVDADHAASDSLRKQIEQEEANLYYSAGFGKSNVDPSSMSGLALLISREDFFINCDALKQAIELAENRVMQLIADKENFEYIPVQYSNRYIADDNNAELTKLRDLLALPLPNAFKKAAIRNYIDTFYSLSEDEIAKIEEEMSQEVQ